MLDHILDLRYFRGGIRAVPDHTARDPPALLERTIPPSVENLAAYASIASVPSLVVLYLAWIKKPGIGRKVILFFAIPLAIAAYTIDVSDRLGWIKLSDTGDLISKWGRQDGTLFITVNSRFLIRYKDNFKMMLIIEIPYSHIDRMTDTAIEKSSLFMITGDPQTIAVAASPTQLRLIPPTNYKIGDAFNLVVSYILVIIPNHFSGEQIQSLSDIEKLGGKIIAQQAMNIQFTSGKPAG